MLFVQKFSFIPRMKPTLIENCHTTTKCVTLLKHTFYYIISHYICV